MHLISAAGSRRGRFVRAWMEAKLNLASCNAARLVVVIDRYRGSSLLAWLSGARRGGARRRTTGSAGAHERESSESTTGRARASKCVGVYMHVHLYIPAVDIVSAEGWLQPPSSHRRRYPVRHCHHPTATSATYDHNTVATTITVTLNITFIVTSCCFVAAVIISQSPPQSTSSTLPPPSLHPLSLKQHYKVHTLYIHIRYILYTRRDTASATKPFAVSLTRRRLCPYPFPQNLSDSLPYIDVELINFTSAAPNNARARSRPATLQRAETAHTALLGGDSASRAFGIQSLSLLIISRISSGVQAHANPSSSQSPLPSALPNAIRNTRP